MANYHSLINEHFGALELPEEPKNLYQPIRYMISREEMDASNYVYRHVLYLEAM